MKRRKRRGRKPSILRFIKVKEIPAKWGRKVISRSKYYPYLSRLANKKKGSKVIVKNGSISSLALYGHLKEVCEKAKIKNLWFQIRGKELFCEVK